MMVASVPHTGSHWLLSLLGLDDSSLRHVYSGESLEVIQAHTGLLVVPLRHPKSVAQSWVNRGKPILPHPVHSCMLEMWENLIGIVDRLKPLYLPLDVPTRDICLKVLGAELGREITTDWKPVGHVNAPPKALSDAEVLAVEALARRPFFQRFGYA